MTSINKPDWLKSLNPPATPEPVAQPTAQPTAEALVTESNSEAVEEVAIPLPVYAPPPPLKQAIGRGVRQKDEEPNTKLPFVFDATKFESAIEDAEEDHIQQVYEQNYSNNVVTHGSPELDADAAKLDAMFGEGTSGPTLQDIGLPPGKYDVVIDNVVSDGKTIHASVSQVYPLLAPDYIKELAESNPDERAAQFYTNMHDASLAEAVTKTGQEALRGLFNAIPELPAPFLPNTEALLPEPKVGLEGREKVEPDWLNTLTPSESIAFDNHIELMLQTNPVHASHLLRLKAFASRHIGVIRTPEQAEEHIRVCQLRGEDIGGWEDNTHARIRQAQEQLIRAARQKARDEARVRYRQHINKARDAWKEAIAQRKELLERQDSIVKNLHEAYNTTKAMSFEEYCARLEAEEL